jgi:hypothetical protein
VHLNGSISEHAVSKRAALGIVQNERSAIQWQS